MMKRQTQTDRRRRRLGFTLLEVLLVLAILGVIAAMVVPNLLGRQQKAYIDQTKINITSLENTLKQYALDHDGVYPQSLEDLVTPVDRDEQPMQPYISKIPLDAWGQPLNYEEPQQETTTSLLVARIWSNGPNRQNDDGSGDDISNWEDEQQK